MVLTVGGGIVAYLDFNERQTLLEAGRKVESVLNLLHRVSHLGNIEISFFLLVRTQVYI